MKNLKICLISLAVSPDTADGEAKVAKAHFDYLKKKRYNVKLITGKWNRDLKKSDIVQFDLIGKRFLWIFHFTYKVIQYLRTHRFDIIHANSPKAAFPIILSGTKEFITTIHDFTPFETKLTLIPLEKYLIKLVSKKSRYILTVSNYIKRRFKIFIPNIRFDKIYNIYNGIEEKYKPYPKEAQDLKNRLNIHSPILLYVGRIASYKGVDHIIEAYNLIKKDFDNLNLVIGGTPDFQMQKKYNKWKEDYKDIHFLGYIPEEKMPLYYSMADIFLTYSNSSEGFGLTPLEAIACGTPVICSSIDVFREILEENAIFVPPNNPQRLSEEISRLIKDEKLRSELVNKAQEFIKRYSWDAVGKRLEEIYKKFLN